MQSWWWTVETSLITATLQLLLCLPLFLQLQPLFFWLPLFLQLPLLLKLLLWLQLQICLPLQPLIPIQVKYIELTITKVKLISIIVSSLLCGPDCADSLLYLVSCLVKARNKDGAGEEFLPLRIPDSRPSAKWFDDCVSCWFKLAMHMKVKFAFK